MKCRETEISNNQEGPMPSFTATMKSISTCMINAGWWQCRASRDNR
jgi:hypothetical protein